MTRGLGIAGGLAVVLVAALGQAPINAQQHLATPKPSGGALAASNYQCVQGQTLGPGVPLNFSSDGVSFGSGISTTGGQFNSFILQQGIYQVHLSGYAFEAYAGIPDITANLNNVATTSWHVTSGTNSDYLIIGGDRLVSVAGANTTLQFGFSPGINGVNGLCRLIITRLQ